MKKHLCLLAGVVAALGLVCQSAEAQPRRGAVRQSAPDVYIGPFRIGDPEVFLVGVGVGLGMTGTYFAIRNEQSLRFAGDGGNFSTGAFLLTTVGCMTLAPMIAAAVVYSSQGRNLTRREAMGLGAGCIIPFIGPLIIDAAFDAHPEWPQ